MIRELQPSGSAGALEVIGAAFGADDPAEGALLVSLWQAVRDAQLVIGEWVAVEDEDALIGHVGVSRAWLDTRSRLLEVAVLSPLSTIPAARGRGCATALIEAAVTGADAAGFPLIFVEGDPGFYSARGFRPGADFGCQAPSVRIPGPAFQAVALAAHEPWMQGRLIYPDVWWRHDAVGLRDPMLAEIEAELTGGSGA